MAVPLDATDWSSLASRQRFTFACTASGVAAKCARNWGYKPWEPPYTESVWNGSAFVDEQVSLAPFYNACLIAARAGYCQDNQSFTENGTTVDLFDSLGDGFTSINATAGIPFAPNASGVMLHEEYQISVNNYVDPTANDLTRPADDVAKIKLLHKSGLESSRYPDLDPGRSCLASNYLDRCAPKEPYDCYREDNMSSQGYGAFLAVNSPRHCSHNAANEGEALDPMCNECVNRICQIRPQCCGDPGSSYFPGSLVWDDQCVAIEQDVCRSTPDGEVWDAGTPAQPASTHVYAFQRGAIGSFERIVTVAATSYAEGWACDPDFPTASIPVQLSVNGALGAPNTNLFTTTADVELAPEWRQTVAMECGETSLAGRHGFRFALPSNPPGQDVYAYGIDLNVPGAPFSLLRGGKKTAPGGAGLPAVQAALWTGWIEPTTSDTYSFSVDAGDGDLYRVWVNGIYVAGNWIDPDPTVSGAFTVQLGDSVPTLHLQRGVRYGVRVEYLRPDPTTLPQQFGGSRFHLRWSEAGAAAVEVKGDFLFPVAQGSGNGLQANFVSDAADGGASSSADGGGSGSGSPSSPNYGAVDFTWTHGKPPAPGIDIASAFSAKFQGQVVPPISGSYTFTADTDGAVTILVNSQPVTDQSTQPPATNPDTCLHDICNTGSAVSRTCAQGDFCANQICRSDDYCCSITWDDRCVEAVASVCKLECTRTAPIAIALQAGVKYDIEVDYHHAGGAGGSLHLMWALPGGPRSVIPASRLFADDGLTLAQRELPGSVSSPTPQGVGLNAAYFSSADFTGEYLDRVTTTLFDVAQSSPSAFTASSMMSAGAIASCAAGNDPLGAPAIAQPVDQAVVTRPAAQPVTIAGSGSRGAAIVVFDGGAQIGTATADATSGIFSVSAILSSGKHALSAVQSCGGTSVPSAPIAVEVRDAPDPNAPAPPTLTQPPNAIVTDEPTVAVAGTAKPGATNVSVTVGGSTQTFSVDPSTGAWSGVVTLPGPGGYELTFTQTVGGHTSVAAPPLDVTVNPPALTLTSPTSSPVSSPVTIAGQNASSALGDVLVAEKDGEIFLAPVFTMPVATDGGFSGQLSLDYGQHTLKVYQHAPELDGDGVTVTVQVPPPRDGLLIQTPASGARVPQNVVVSGGGGLTRTGAGGTGLRGSINIYQATPNGDVLLASGPLDDEGRFTVPVTLAGAGKQTISVSQTARSLSGGGSAESAKSDPVALFVIPPPPVLTSPTSGMTQDSLTISVSGSSLPLAFVDLGLVGSNASHPGATAHVQADDGGSFNATLTVSASGTYLVSATQTVDSTQSSSSGPRFVALGDTTPPTVCAPPLVSQPATDAAGTVVSFAGQVIATDATPPVDCAKLLSSGATTTLAVSCLPASGSLFPLGTTKVTCEAFDQAGNRGAVTFAVSVTSSAGPVISTAGLTAEAQGPNGAPVNYRVTATGWVADCSPAGSIQVSPCASWQPASTGLGFAPRGVTQDTDPQSPSFGTLYAGFRIDDVVDHILASSDGGQKWRELTSSGAGKVTGIMAGGGSIYVPSDEGRGIRVSRDGGVSWQSALDGQALVAIQDPVHPQHMMAWTDVRRSSPAMFETYDGWATSSAVTLQGLPSTQILTVGWDPDHPPGKYVSVDADCPPDQGCVQLRLYYGDGNHPWQQLNVPDSFMETVTSIDTAPGGKVVAGTTMSTDGGHSWTALTLPAGAGNLVKVLFDANGSPIFAGSDLGLLVAQPASGGAIWSTANNGPPTSSVYSLIQDVTDPTVLYGVQGVAGLYRYQLAADGTIDWQFVPAKDVVLPASEIMDVAVDPVDPDVAYALSHFGGIAKTTDGGAHWKPSNGTLVGQFSVSEQISFQDTGPVVIAREQLADASQLTIDRFNRNVVYLGAGGLWKSTDAAGTWSNLIDDNYFNTFFEIQAAPFAFSVNPYVQNTIYLGTDPVIFDTDYGRISYGELQNGSFFGAGTTIVRPADGTISAMDFQFVPDAARSVIMSIDIGGSYVIEPPSSSPISGFGHSTFDASDGTNSVFTDGSNVGTGTDQSVLYRASLSDMQWHRLGGGDGLTTGFSPLLIDPASGGRVMYTRGNDDTFWRSGDGGRTWQRDQEAPSFVTQAWFSAVDGSVYATVAPQPSTAFSDPRGVWPGALWKRTVGTGTPPSARVVSSDVRVSCQGTGDAAATPGSVFPLGETTLHCTATDSFKNTSTKDVTITVQDTTPPIIIFTGPTSAIAPAAASSATVSLPVFARDSLDGDIHFDSVDKQGQPKLVCTVPSPAQLPQLPIGSTLITCTAHDEHQNTTSLTFSYQVTSGDDLPTQPNETLYVAVPGDQLLTAVDPSGATLDPTLSVYGYWYIYLPSYPYYSAGSVPATCAPSLSSPFPLGLTDVVCSASTPDGLIVQTSSFRVDVVDGAPPVITLPPSLPLHASATGPFGGAVQFAPTAKDAIDGNVPVNCLPPSGSTFPIGTSEVSCSAVDSSGNRADATFDVSVGDGNAPVLHLGDTTVNATDATGATDVTFNPEPTATDDTGIGSFECLPAEGNWFPLGDTTVTCTATDTSGNEATGAFTVHVADRGAPIVTVPPTITVEAQGSDGAKVSFDVSAIDVVHGTLTPTCTRADKLGTAEPIASGDVFPLGDTTLTCTAVDDDGNAGAASFVVVVHDTTSPALNLPLPISTTADGTGTVVVDYAATASDLVGGNLPVGCKPPPGNRFGLGTTLVTCLARDGAGNEVTGAFTVTVTPPYGGPCSSSADCAAGSCVDGVCCNTKAKSCGQCRACNVPGSVGTCAATSGGACDDANACTQGDTCQNGTCSGGAPVTCRASDQCHAAGTCDPTTGACSNPPTANGTSCNDGNLCTQTDTCQGGACMGSNPVTCAASDQCHVPGACNPSTGACSNPTAANGTSCNDGNACTRTDTCQAGTCTGSNQVTCAASDQCHVPGSCNPSTGVCSNPPAANGAGCNDGNACTRTDTCQAGTCTGSDAVTCTASDQCHVPGSCNPSTGVCSNPTAANGTTCNDGNACTTGDACSAGACVGGAPPSCDDHNPCTVDSCIPASGCKSTPGNPGAVCRAASNSCDSAESCTGTSATCPADTDKQAPKLSPGTNQTLVGTCSSVPVPFTVPTLASSSCETGTKVTCTALPGNSYGTHTVTCTAKDASGNVSAPVTFTVTVLQPLTVRIQPPLSGDNDTVDNIVKLGSTVPTKVQLYACGANVTTTASVVAKLAVTYLPSGGSSSSQPVTTFTDPVDTNGIMVLDGKNYRYNLSTKGLSVTAGIPAFYQENITVAYKSAPSVVVGSDAIELDTK